MSIENNHWAPGIGDPTIIGWVTVAVYFAVAVICLKAALTPHREHSLNTPNSEKSLKAFWLFLTIFLVALGINKQLDLQTLLTQIGRDLVIEQGWYKNRHTVKIALIILLGSLGITALTILIKTYHHTCFTVKIALAGCIILFLFILLSASSFKPIEIFVNIKLAGVKMKGILELGGLAIIGIAGYQYRVQHKICSN